jgi:uncharacterized membrane protein
MLDTRIPSFGLVWMGLTVAYLACTALGHRPGAMAVLGLLAGTLVVISGRRLLGLITGVALAAAAWRFAGSIGFLVYMPPLAAFAFMAAFFGRTLRKGSEPLISRIARKEHSTLSPEVARHTRLLTGAWTACFMALFLVSADLASVLSLEAWSIWVQGLGVIVPGALFLGEYAYSRYRFPHRPRGSLGVLVGNVVAVFREIAMESGGPMAPGGKRP